MRYDWSERDELKQDLIWVETVCNRIRILPDKMIQNEIRLCNIVQSREIQLIGIQRTLVMLYFLVIPVLQFTVKILLVIVILFR